MALDLKTKQAIQRFLNQYPEIFDDYEKEYLLNYRIGSRDEDIPDLVREVYDELGLLKDKDNIFIGFQELIGEHFDLKNSNIVEVAGGIIPRLGKRISSIQERGKITVYDPRISPYEKNTSHLKLVRKRFHEDTRINGSDLIIGLMPCQATYPLLWSAFKTQTPFMVALCEGGPHGEPYDFYEDADEWVHGVLCYADNQAKKNGMGPLVVLEEVFKDDYHDPWPVIYCKKR